MSKILRAITTRYMVVFMSLIIVTIFVLGVLITSIITSYSVDEKMEELSASNMIFKAYYQVNDTVAKQYFKETDAQLKSVLTAIFLASDSSQIIVADRDGQIIIHAYKGTAEQSPVIRYIEQEEAEVGFLKTSSIPKKTISAVVKEGDLSMNNNCNDLFYDKVIWFASALENRDGEVDGFIISFEGEGEGTDLIFEMLRSISFTAIWLSVVMLVVIYVVSYKVTTPLREISNAAKSFARGKYNVRVPERGNDEITDLARSFNKMAVEIQSKDDMQKQFLSSVSHDLRTPMTTIAGFIDGILDGAIPKEKEEYYLDIIKSEVKRLSRLVSSLLDISRLQSGDRKFDKKPFNLCELSRKTIISFEQQFDEKELCVEFNTEEYDIWANGDMDAINQVVYNLCHNAIKFSYPKSKYIVDISYVDDDKVSFSVYNEGIGIAKEEIPFVFDRFYKSDKSRGLDKTGVGLGLFISKTIIDSHEGDMRVESEYEKWCKFSFTLEKA